VLRLGNQEFGPDDRVVMGILNRTPDSFYETHFELDAALARIDDVVAQGGQILDIGGVRAGEEGPVVSAAEELARTRDVVAAARERHAHLVISIDTWRSEVADQLCGLGADLVNDTWAGHDPELAAVAARHGAGLVCSHTGGLPPRTDPVRPEYPDVVAAVIETVTALAAKAVAAGVRADGLLIDPTHDFGKTTAHSLELTRRLDELVATGWPVLVALSNKDFVGETLGLPKEARLPGTLAATAISAWHGARVYRAHNVAQTRQTLDMVASIMGTRPPTVQKRGL
jgi:dihydropteroate synthase